MSKNLKCIMIVNGVQFRKNGTPDPEFTARLDKAAQIAKQRRTDAIIISGGVTRTGSPSEASFGETYLKESGQTTFPHIPIFKEEKSHTTIENIRYVKRMFAAGVEHALFDMDDVEKIIAVTSSGRLLRLKYLYKTLWPEAYSKMEFFVAPHSKSASARIIHSFMEFLYLIYTKIDMEEKLLVRFAKKAFRNFKSGGL